MQFARERVEAVQIVGGCGWILAIFFKVELIEPNNQLDLGKEREIGMISRFLSEQLHES